MDCIDNRESYLIGIYIINRGSEEDNSAGAKWADEGRRYLCSYCII